MSRFSSFRYFPDPVAICQAIRWYLIVIDDIWDVQTWTNLECAFVKSGHGSRVMSTTRNTDVAKSCCSSDLNLVYKIKPLGNADSAKLFFKRIFGCEERCPSNLKEVSEDILKKCGGLPLAINAISSLLATRKTEQEWNRIRSCMTSAEGENSDVEAMKYILSLSYFDLPLHLRSCLLYLTMFPEDYVIRRKRLVHRWISEGFIRGKDREDPVELGDTYFHELVNRSLIQPLYINYNGKASCCRVHDTVLDFLIYMSDKENFCTFLSIKAKPDRRIRRLSLMGNEDQGIIEQLDLSHARSLGFFEYTKKLPSLMKSDALRVLDLGACYHLKYHHVEDIGKLIQLRYLNIEGTGTSMEHQLSITELPKEIGDLEYLETLIIASGCPHVLPESVHRLKRLVRLSVGYGLHTKLPDAIGNMENLQELGLINPFVQSLSFAEELGKLINLRKLKMYWCPSKSDNASYKKKIVSSLCKLDNCNLRYLSIKFWLKEEDGFIRDLCFPSLNCVRNICLMHGKFRWIAKWLPLLPNLQKLRIMGETALQHLKMVGSISTLVKFELLLYRSGSIVIFSGGFQQVRKLKVKGFTGLMFEAGAMPNLKVLELDAHPGNIQSRGSSLDFGIQHLASLDSIHVYLHCHKVKAVDVEAVERALKSMAEANPNRPALEIRRLSEESMIRDE